MFPSVKLLVFVTDAAGTDPAPLDLISDHNQRLGNTVVAWTVGIGDSRCSGR